MIKKITLTNFQSHKKTDLELHPGVNVIIGDSRSGKTAILRALNWNRYNKPFGLSMNSYWNRNKKKEPIEDHSVAVVFDDTAIERKRSSDFNGYINASEIMEAVGKSVPESIENAWNMSEVNIQKQFDAPFLISDGSAEIARFLNKTIHLDKIDRVLSTAETERRKINSDINENKKLQDKLAVDIEEMSWIDETEELITCALKIREDGSKKVEMADSLGDLLDKIDAEQTKIEAFPEALIQTMVGVMERAEALSGRIAETKVEFNFLKGDLELIRRFKAEITGLPAQEELNNALKAIEETASLDGNIEGRVKNEVRLDELIKKVKSVHAEIARLPEDKEIKKVAELFEKTEKLDSHIKDSIDTMSRLRALIRCVNTNNIIEITQEIESLQDQMPETCPACGQIIRR